MVSSKSVRGRPAWGWLVFCIVGITSSAASRVEALQQVEVIVRNGLIVTEDGRQEADIRIRGETIVEIGPNLAAAAGARVIDARGMLVMPGAVDTHTHLNAEMPDPPRPNRPQDDYVTGSAAAFAGCVTTISNFIPLHPGDNFGNLSFSLAIDGEIRQRGHTGDMITPVLTLIAYRFALGNYVPRLPYMTRMDYFITGSTLIVFPTLAQVTLTSSLARHGREQLSRRIDRLARYAFPCGFLAITFFSLF